MRLTWRAAALGVLASVALGSTALAQNVTVPQGTPVTLVFDQAVSSKTAREGQSVRLHVRDTVDISGTTILPTGTPVTGVISKVDKRKRYGVNAKLRIALNPVRLPENRGTLLLEPRSQGKYVQGKKSGEAAAATAGGAIVAGPVGLIGGYFVHGKSVNIKAGDTFDTVVSQSMTFHP